MNCPACKAHMTEGSTELVFKRGRSVVVVENIPAIVCKQCGEASLDSATSQKAYDLADAEIKKGISLEFCDFKAA